MNVLVLAPHPDDESIGCGGSLALHASDRAFVTVVFLTSGELGLKHLIRENAWRIREKEARDAAKILGLDALHFLRFPDWEVNQHVDAAASKLTPLLCQYSPGTIYLPHPQDAHPDHQATWSVLKLAARQARLNSAEIRAYEVWSPLSQVDYAVNITKVMPKKMRALRAHESQLGEFNYEQALQGLNLYRGALHGKCRYAEVFMDLSDRLHEK